MLSVIIPCYNEALNLPIIFESFQKAIGEKNDIEVILVNNGSKDNSKEVLEALLAKDSRHIFKVTEVKENKGYGYGILCGLREARGEVMAWTHADLQTDPYDVIVAYEKFLDTGDPNIFVKGKRKDRQLHAWFFSWGMQVLSSWALNNNLDDINAQPKVFSRTFYENYLKEKAPSDFSLDLYAHYWAKRTGKVVDIPVVVMKRKFGEAKGGGSIKTKIKLIYRTFNYIFDLRKKLSEENQI